MHIIYTFNLTFMTDMIYKEDVINYNIQEIIFMRSKRLIALCLAGTLAAGSIAGCSRSKIRKIEGASDDTMKFVSVIEEVYDMKGFQSEVSTTISGVDIFAKSIVDKNNNFQVTVSVKADIQTVKLDDELVTLSLIGNDVYIDLTKGYEALKRVAGEAAFAALKQELGSDFVITDYLVTKMSLGDIDRSAISVDAVKELGMKAADIFAVALTKSNTLTVNDNKYSATLTSEVKEGSFVYSMLQGIVDNKEFLFDKVVKYLEDLKLADNLLKMYDIALEEVKKIPEFKELMGEPDMSEVDELKDELKQDINSGIDEIKNKREEILADITMDDIVMEDADGAEISFTVEDTKEGYIVSLKADGDTVIENATITEYKDTIKAPELTSDKGSLPILLSGILAPQYLKYVEKSRNASDNMLIDSVYSAIKVQLYDADVISTLPNSFTIYFDGSSISSDENIDALINGVMDIVGGFPGFQSDRYKYTTIEYYIEYDKSSSSYVINTQDGPYIEY